MGELTRQLRQRILEALESLAILDTERGRTLLLNDLPTPLVRNIDRGPSKILDLHAIVDGCARWQAGPGSTAPLETLLENAISLAEGQRTATDLQAVLDILRTAGAPVIADPPALNSASRTGQYAPNPFATTGQITNPEEFVGRERLLDELFEALSRGSNRVLVGEAQVGKSSLLAMVRAQGPTRLGLPAETFIHLDMRTIYDEKDLFEALCGELGVTTSRGYKLGRQLSGKRYILCLDEIEKMRHKERFSGEEREELRGLADGANMPLTLLIASRVPLEELFPDSGRGTSPLANICLPLDVPPFTEEEARRFLAQRLRGTGVSFDPDEIAGLLAQSGRHPARLQRAAFTLYRRLTQDA